MRRFRGTRYNTDMIAPGSQVRGIIAAIWCLTLGIAWFLTQTGAFYGVSWLNGPLGSRLEWVYAGFLMAFLLLAVHDFREGAGRLVDDRSSVERSTADLSLSRAESNPQRPHPAPIATRQCDEGTAEE